MAPPFRRPCRDSSGHSHVFRPSAAEAAKTTRTVLLETRSISLGAFPCRTGKAPLAETMRRNSVVAPRSLFATEPSCRTFESTGIRTRQTGSTSVKLSRPFSAYRSWSKRKPQSSDRCPSRRADYGDIVPGAKSPLNAILEQTNTRYYAQQIVRRSRA